MAETAVLAPVGTGAARDVTRRVVGLARTLRAAGVDASPDRVLRMVDALDVLGAARRQDVYWSGRLTLCGSEEDIGRYDRVFAAYFDGQPLRRHRAAPPALRPVRVLSDPAADSPQGAGDTDERIRALTTASETELLRHRDVASLSRADRDAVRRLLAAFRLPGELRRTRRLGPHHRGRIDRARTMRELLRRGGEPSALPRRAHRRRPRRVVLLVDVSGSMSVYADALLRFAHAATRRGGAGVRTEVFTIGTRLTRVTRELGSRDPDTAMAGLTAAVPDWSGGTRLGELVKEFLDRWGQRGMARGSVVVVLSDGWERGSAVLLGEQMERLHRLAHRVVWANPRKARPGYAPLAAGMAAALPFVDDFVEGHSVAALERLAAVVAGSAAASAAGSVCRA